MGRAKLRAGEVGNITTTKLGYRKYEARARLRTFTGELRQVKAQGEKAEAARENLRQRARSLAYVGVVGMVSIDTTIDALAAMTLDYLRSLPIEKMRPQTVDQYATILPIVRGENPRYTGLNNLAIGDITTPAPIHAWLWAVSEVSPSSGKLARTVLLHAFDFAAKKGVRPWGIVNPAKEAELRKPKKRTKTAPTADELAGLRDAVAKWQTPVKRTNLLGIVDMITATGARPNEVLALRWSDFDLAATPPTVTISGTLVELRGTREDGGGVVRQDFPKSDAGYRTLSLPSWAAAQAMEMRVLSVSDRVFPNEKGGWLSLRNIDARFRDARGEKFKDVTLYSYRRSVATLIDAALGMEKAAKQLGHESPAITGRHYVKRAAAAGDYTAVLEMLAPRSTGT